MATKTEEEIRKEAQRQAQIEQAQAASNNLQQQAGSVSVAGVGGDQQTVTNSASSQQQTQSGVSSQYSQQSGQTEQYLAPTEEDKTNAQQRYEDQMRSRGYVWDDDKKEYVQGTYFDALKLDRDNLRQERERQEKQDRLKKLNASVYNAGALISDIISGAIGGNVYQRAKDNTVEDADKDIARLRELQATEDAANAMADQKEKQEALTAAQKAYDEYMQTYGKRVQTQQSSGSQYGQSVTNSATVAKSQQKSGTTYSDKYWDNHTRVARATSASSSSGGGKKGSIGTLNINIKRGANGQEMLQYPISQTAKEALANRLSNKIVERATADENYRRELTQAGVIEEKTIGTGVDAVTTWSVKDPERLLDDGNAMEIPELMNTYLDYMQIYGGYKRGETPLTRSELYEMITGEDIHDTDGKLNAYKVQELQSKGIYFPNEAVSNAQKKGGRLTSTKVDSRTISR